MLGVLGQSKIWNAAFMKNWLFRWNSEPPDDQDLLFLRGKRLEGYLQNVVKFLLVVGSSHRDRPCHHVPSFSTCRIRRLIVE